MNAIHHLKPVQCHHTTTIITKPSSHINPIPSWKVQPMSSIHLLLALRRKRSSHHRIHAGGGFGATKNTEKKNNDLEDDDDEIPQEVYDRMLRRIAVFVGAPVVSGVGLLYLLSALKENKIWDVPMWVPFVCALFAFGTSALGIAYGTLSSSWEAEREGSLLGWDEAQKNWPVLWKDNAAATSVDDKNNRD